MEYSNIDVRAFASNAYYFLGNSGKQLWHDYETVGWKHMPEVFAKVLLSHGYGERVAIEFRQYCYNNTKWEETEDAA